MTSKVPTPVDFASLDFQPFDVGSLVDELLDSAGSVRDGRSSRTLAKSKALTVVVTALRAGHRLEEHAVSGPAIIVGIKGAVTFTSLGAESNAVVGPGRILMMGENEKHTVSANEDSGFLIVLGPQS